MPVSTGVAVDAVGYIGTPGFSSVIERRINGVKWMPAGLGVVRSGVCPGGGGVVTVTGAVGSEQWNLAPMQFVLGDATGGCYEVDVYSGKSEAYPTRPASGNARYDALVLEPVDTGVASGRYCRLRLYYGVASGSPSLAATLALVPSGAYVLATMYATNGAAPVVTQKLPRTVPVGSVLPVADATERDAIVSPPKGQVIYREDLNTHEVNTGTPSTVVWGALGGGPHFRGLGNTTGSAQTYPVVFGAIEDTEGGWSAANNVYTVKKAGIYRVTASVQTSGSVNGPQLLIRKNGAAGTNVFYFAAAYTGILNGSPLDVRCAVGDTLGVEVSPSMTIVNANSFLHIDYVRP